MTIIRNFKRCKEEIDSTATTNFVNYLKEKIDYFFAACYRKFCTSYAQRREENKHVSWNGKRQTPKSWPRLYIWIEVWIATSKTMMWVCRWEKSILVKRSIDEMGAQMFRWMAGCPGGKCGTRLRQKCIKRPARYLGMNERTEWMGKLADGRAVTRRIRDRPAER